MTNEKQNEEPVSQINKESKDNQSVLVPIKEYERLKEQETLSKRYLASLRQLQADFENFRRITEKNKAFHARYGNEQIIKKLLTFYDDLNRAVDMIKNSEEEKVTLEYFLTLKKGLEMLKDNLQYLLESEGVRRINAPGKPFDPFEHEVLLIEETSNVPDNICLEEIEHGYYYKDRVIRPSKVKISRYNEPIIEKISN